LRWGAPGGAGIAWTRRAAAGRRILSPMSAVGPRTTPGSGGAANRPNTAAGAAGIRPTITRIAEATGAASRATTMSGTSPMMPAIVEGWEGQRGPLPAAGLRAGAGAGEVTPAWPFA
jgi:hypothetical protein